jgi:DNA repair protein RadD
MKQSLMPNKITLFEYQEKCVKDCLDYLRGPSKKPAVVVAPTAGGKSFLIASIADTYGKPILVLQPSRELLEQNFEKLIMIGGSASIYSASMNTKELGHLTFATLGSIKNMGETFKALGVETVIIDEVHFGNPPTPNSMFMKFMNILQPKKVIGFTATPFRLKSAMSGSRLVMLNRERPGYFREFIHVIQVQEIINEKRWSKIEYEKHFFDESALELNSTGADYKEESVKAAIKAQKTNNKIYLRIKELQATKRGILVFMDTLENAEIMSNHIPRSAYLGSDTPKKERNQIIKDFKSGKIQVLCNHRILTTGFDCPELDCIIVGYPTNSLATYYQIVGRGTRVHPDKKDCLYIDYCNNLHRFGKVENLVIEDVPGWGWGVFNGEVALTDVILGGFKVTREDIENKRLGISTPSVTKIWFGKYNGTPLNELPLSFIKWMLANRPFNGPKMEALQKEFIRLLKSDQEKLILE